ncbi:MAG: discoidin domain-containing protein [Phycisphaerae bacterium]|nr:discoidin domain-containing protein [Phycisphaerae bacterium]
MKIYTFRLHLLVASFVLVLLVSPAPARTIDVGDSVRELVEADWIRADMEFAFGESGASAAPSGPVTTAQDAAGGCDGVRDGGFGFHVASGEMDPWWQVDLGRTVKLDRVVVHNRTDGGTAGRTLNIQVLLNESGKGSEFRLVYQHDGNVFYGGDRALTVSMKDKNVSARIVRLAVPGRCSFALDEVDVYAVDDPAKNIALGKPADQKSTSSHSTFNTEGLHRGPTSGGFLLGHTKQVVERAEQLVRRLKRQGADASKLRKLSADLVSLTESMKGDVSQEKRKALYFEARALKRQIALSNPLLDFDKILFIKRHDSVGVFHMCDQYYGCNAKPGGGLFVLSDPFGEKPRLTNVLENSVVERGRLRGDNLSAGAFLSPELSYDGKTILFAYTRAKAYEKYGGKEAYEWGPEISYHIFKVNADGSGLVQLTDGASDDFDPCFLPNGRIVFITERRGGYLRCGRHCPVYTMYSMEPDGSDIICVSFHETHEWHPSVDNDGMLVYTRWDYVDRDTNIAHHIWTSFPDGRSPRSFHGNYPARRENRPWMEMSIRAIPGSHRYVAATGSHHGNAFGSLIMIDPRLEDDRAMSQLTRLTPDAPFPEAEAKPIRNYMRYGTPWPLSEDDYLCVYDADAKNRGIYWIDRFGNKELLYRDPSISCLSPIPLRPRHKPPVVPSGTVQTARDIAKAGGEVPQETITIVNVYDSDFAWPEGSKVAALRIIQALPKTTPPPNQPRIGIANQTNARVVLGTAPVEPDGSAYFEAPVGKAIYFQALDERGMAIQSMRSATYVHPGEQMTCLGCHEQKHQTSKQPTARPLALLRGPSKIQPDVDGSNPFNYVRLVQPALDRNCVSCHSSEEAIDLAGVVEGENGWTRSYNNLAAKYGFYFHVGNGAINEGVHGGSRTIAGKFGARVSGLLEFMDERHYGVKLSDEDFHRLTLWLDCNSEFYGSYENTVAQANGQIVLPTLD